MTFAGLHAFCEWLVKTPPSNVIQSVLWIVPTVQTVHILGIAIVSSAAFLLDLRFLGVISPKQATGAMVTRYIPWIWPTLVVLLLTGIVMIMGEPSRSLENSVFQLKMTLLILAIGVTAAIQAPIRHDPAYWELNGRQGLVRLLAVISILLWVGIIFCGRIIAYV